MIMYLAATAPGNENIHEDQMMPIQERLLSYYLIRENKFECRNVFNAIVQKIKNKNTDGNKKRTTR